MGQEKLSSGSYSSSEPDSQQVTQGEEDAQSRDSNKREVAIPPDGISGRDVDVPGLPNQVADELMDNDKPTKPIEGKLDREKLLKKAEQKKRELEELLGQRKALMDYLDVTYNPRSLAQLRQDLRECERDIAELEANLEPAERKKLSAEQITETEARLDLLYATKAELQTLIILAQNPLDRRQLELQLRHVDRRIQEVQTEWEELKTRLSNLDLS